MIEKLLCEGAARRLRDPALPWLLPGGSGGHIAKDQSVKAPPSVPAELTIVGWTASTPFTSLGPYLPVRHGALSPGSVLIPSCFKLLSVSLCVRILQLEVSPFELGTCSLDT